MRGLHSLTVPFPRGLLFPGLRLENLPNPLDQSVRKTRQSFFGRIRGIFAQPALDEDLLDDLEALLIQADVGVETSELAIEALRQRVQEDRIDDSESAVGALRAILIQTLHSAGDPAGLRMNPAGLTVVLIVGVNGSGKTTTVAKLAQHLRADNSRVMLAAADTFRAAADDQLKIWAGRVGVPVVSHQPGADPGAVVFDAMESAQARGYDVLLVDTAGRLHTKSNLMDELAKIRRVISRRIPDAPHETLLVLDATTGQNAVVQAREFLQSAGVTGLVLAKLDGTAKGGIVFSIARELKLPILFAGTGESADDLTAFEAAQFVDALLRRD